MSQENLDSFTQFSPENNAENERVYTPEEEAVITEFRANQTRVLEALIEKDEIETYASLAPAFREALLSEKPELAKHDNEVNLDEYEKYAMWHFLAGSTPRSSAVYFDFPEGDSVQEYMQSLVEQHVPEKELDNSE